MSYNQSFQLNLVVWTVHNLLLYPHFYFDSVSEITFPPLLTPFSFLVVHNSVQAQDRPTATVSPLRSQNSPSRLPATVIRSHSVVSPQHIHHSPVHVIPGAQCARPIIPLTSAAAAITPPNVTAVNLNGDAGNGPISSLVTCSPTNTAGKTEERKNEKVNDHIATWKSMLCLKRIN